MRSTTVLSCGKPELNLPDDVRGNAVDGAPSSIRSLRDEVAAVDDDEQVCG